MTMTVPKENIAVVSASGPVGGVLANTLADKGHNVIRIGRPEKVKALRELGHNASLSIVKNKKLIPVEMKAQPTFLTYDEAKENPPDISTILYAVNGNFLKFAVEQTAHFHQKDGLKTIFAHAGLPLYTFHNSNSQKLFALCDPDGVIKTCFPKLDNVFSAMVTFAAGIDPKNPLHTILKSDKALTICNANDNVQKAKEIGQLLDNPLLQKSNISDDFRKTALGKAIGSFGMHIAALLAAARGGKGTLGEITEDQDMLRWMVNSTTLLCNAVKTLGIDITMDYREYFLGIAKGSEDHIVSSVKNPGNIPQVLTAYNVAMTTELSSEVVQLKPQIEEALRKPNNDLEQQGMPIIAFG